MANLDIEEPNKRKTKTPHEAPRNPEKLREIARLRNEEKLDWRSIGSRVGISGQGACLLYNLWRERGWFNDTKDTDDTA